MRQKRRRLSRSSEFERVYRHGRSVSSRFLVLYAFPRADSGDAGAGEAVREDGASGQRLGVSVGRRVGGAVTRNRVKRVLREAFWSVGDRLPEGHDYVVVARADAAGLVERDGSQGVARALDELLEKLPPETRSETPKEERA